MKKSKAYILRWFHLMGHFLSFNWKEWHCGINEGISTQFLGIESWFKADKISCTCGKTWYNKN